ncbi:MAG: hypothetical protein ACYDEQ_07705 [Desulfocucumaceae bacterium]
MEPVYFPYDIRRDITFYGLKITKIWIPIVGLIGASLLLLVDIPFLPILFKLLLLFLVPAALFVFFVFDVGEWIKKIKSFINEPPLRLPDSRGNEKSVQYMVDAKARPGGGPFLDNKDGYVGVILSVHPLPWESMPEDEKDLEIAAFRTALRRALGNKVYVSTYTEFDLELPRVDIERKALEWRTRFPVEGSPLRDLAEARLKKFSTDTRTVRPVSHIRLLWKPTNRDLPRKPRDEKERESLINEAYSAIIETFIGNLYSGGINCKIFGAEAARDIASRQLNPADWRRVAPVSNTCWESRLAVQQKQESYSQDKVTEVEKKIGNNINLVVVVTFEKGAKTKPVTLTITEKLLEQGYSISLVDADIHSPGSINSELGIDDLSVGDWRTMPGTDNATAPAKGLMFWGLSNSVYSVELSRSALWRVIEEARKWSHVQIIHLGENEGALPLLSGKAKVIVVTGQEPSNIKMPLKISQTGTILVAENDEQARVSTRNYRARKCYVLGKDIDLLVDYVVGGVND